MTIQPLEFTKRIQDKFETLSKGKKRLARFLLDHWDEAAFYTATELGNKVNVSQSVVVRFTVDLGYPGYPELQKELQHHLKQRLTTLDRFEQLTGQFSHQQQLLERIVRKDFENIEATLQENSWETLVEAAQRFLDAKRIFVVSTSATSAIGVLLTHNLDMVLGNTYFLSNQLGQMFDRLRRVTKQDLVVGISFPRYSALTYNAMRLAKAKQAPVIAISDSVVSPIAQLADTNLVVKTEGVSFARSHVAGVTLANILFAVLSIKDEERVRKALQSFERDRQLWTSTAGLSTGDFLGNEPFGSDGGQGGENGL